MLTPGPQRHLRIETPSMRSAGVPLELLPCPAQNEVSARTTHLLF